MIRRTLAAMPLLLLGACAGQPAPPMVSKVSATPPGGMWEVVKAAPVQATPDKVASPYLGQKMMLTAELAGDPAGRMCKSPAYQGWDMAPSMALGGDGKGVGMASDTARPVLGVVCGADNFGTYVPQADGSLATRVNNWRLTLTRVPEPPKPMIPEPAPMKVMAEPAPASAPSMPMPAPKPEPKALDKSTLVYLASYKTEEKAQAGWKRLAKASPVLAGQKPKTQAVDLGNKGKWVRLYGMAADEAEREKLCKQLGKLVDECGARNRE